MSDMKQAPRVFVMLVASFVHSLITALSMVIITRLTQSGRSPSFSDPFVLTGLMLWVVACGVLTFPIMYLCLRGRRLNVALPIVFGCVALALVAGIPFAGHTACVFSFLALFASLLFCALSRRASLSLEKK
jgi:hypothetical protein